MNRRELLKNIATTGMLSMVPRWLTQDALAGEAKFQYHNPLGQSLLEDSLSLDNFWDDAQKVVYTEKAYDLIQLKAIPNGFVTYISGTGMQRFTPKLVADGIFEHQDLIPKYMESLNTAQYLGRGIDPIHGLAYRDIYFLADIKIFWMSVPLRTVQYQLSDGRYICAIELITENMVNAGTWLKYQEIMDYRLSRVVDGWSWMPVVPMSHIVGYYLVEPDEAYGARVTMITDMAFEKNVSIWADIGSELPFVLRQGMIAGFMGSVQACQAYQQELNSSK